MDTNNGIVVVAPGQVVAPLTEANIESLVNMFIASQDVAKSSRGLYKRTLKQYLDWVNAKGYRLNEIARPQLLEYKQYLEESGKSSLTVGSYITSLRKFYSWTEAIKVYPNVARELHNPKRAKQFRKQPLTPSQATELLVHFQGQALRDYALVNLLVRTGLRTVEAIRADVGDITHKGGKRVLLIQGKGHTDKDSFVVLTDKSYQPIKQYLETRPGVKDTEPLFTSRSNRDQGERLTTRSVSRIAKEGLKAVGLDDKVYTAHSLRHTTAVNILRAGGDLETVQLTLRHSNINTTEIYTQTLNEERRLANSGEALLDKLY